MPQALPGLWKRDKRQPQSAVRMGPAREAPGDAPITATFPRVPMTPWAAAHGRALGQRRPVSPASGPLGPDDPNETTMIVGHAAHDRTHRFFELVAGMAGGGP